MTQPWIPEHPFTLDKVRLWVNRHIPDLADAHISLLGQGWDNVVYLLNEDTVLRTPQRDLALPGFIRECEALEHIQTCLRTPKPKLYDLSYDIHPYPVSVSGFLPGIDSVQLGKDVLCENSAKAMGQFLATLHQIRPKQNLPIDPSQRGDLHFRAQKLLSLTSDPLITPFLGISHITIPKRLALCHGDLHFLHVLLDSNGMPQSVIDWGDMCLANPLIDLSILFLLWDSNGQMALIQTYRELGGELIFEELLAAFILALFLNRALHLYSEDQQKIPLQLYTKRQWDRMLQNTSLESLRELARN